MHYSSFSHHFIQCIIPHFHIILYDHNTLHLVQYVHIKTFDRIALSSQVRFPPRPFQFSVKHLTAWSSAISVADSIAK